MICPHCNTGINLAFEEGFITKEILGGRRGYDVSFDHCPECKKLIIKLRIGTHELTERTWIVSDVESEVFLYPQSSLRPVPLEVPELYRNDYVEACLVLQLSPKASAALSRRLLQRILREEFSIKASDLSKEIDKFIERSDVSASLAGEIDAIRNVGNFAAHPLKVTNTSEIVDVEVGEADWLLEVLDSLFDYAFVQPKRKEERKQKLNDKLNSLGKPPMKNAPKP